MKEQGHYETPLLWKDEPIMQNSRAMEVSRLHSTERKLKKDPELTVKYKKVINNYVNRGHPKKMTHEEAKLRRNPPEVRVTSGQKPCTKMIKIVLQTSAQYLLKNKSFLATPNAKNNC